MCRVSECEHLFAALERYGGYVTVVTNTGVPFLYYQNPLFVTTKTVNMLLTVCQGGHHRPALVNK
jgi:hypothetical protein